MKVGEYVRTKDGYIYKIEDGEEFYEDYVDVGIGTIPDVDGIWVDKEHFQYVDKREIIKSSPNIIDLIEVGDIIKKTYKTGLIEKIPINEIEDIEHIKLDLKNGFKLTIVTNEQFSQMEYRIGE